MNWILQALNGLSMGALLFLLASGFTLIFGLMHVVNLAHGAFYLLGGYIGLSTIRATGNFWLGLVVGGLAIVVVGLSTERFLIRKVINSELGQILLTLGIAYVIADVCLAIWGGLPQRVNPPEWAAGPLHITGQLVYPRYRFFIIGFGAVVAALLWFLQERTKIGVAVRAGVDDREMAGAMGVNIGVLFVIVFGVGSFLAGMSGIIGGGFLTLYPHADWDVLVLALVVVIIGGLGSLKGAMVGALIVGIVDAYGRWLMPDLSYFMIFAPMAILLTIRPQGLFGRKVS
jgi:branched-chain amino acid transport system permease protein